MDDALTVTIDRLLPERLQRLRRLAGLPVAFGGIVRTAPSGRALVLTRLAGTFGTGLRGLSVPPGLGLGGQVLSRATPQRVERYATTTTITHDYDRIVVQEERLTSVVAVPMTARGAVRGVLYAAVRADQPIGDRAVRLVGIVADQLVQDAEDLLKRTPEATPDPVHAALDDLAQLIAETNEPDLRARLQAIYRTITAPARSTERHIALAPREVDALRLVAHGATNAEIAARLGLSPETVKAYLRTAMRKLDAHNRTAAVHAARVAGVL